MKTVESSAAFQPKQWAEKASREDNRKQDPTRTCAQSGVKIETLFEVPLREKMCQGGRPLQVLAAPKAKSNRLMVCADAPRGPSRAMRNLWEPATNMG